MAELHETMYGKKLFEYDLPEIHKQLKRIADTLENKKTVNRTIMEELVDRFSNDADLGDAVRQMFSKKDFSTLEFRDFIEYEEALTNDSGTRNRITKFLKAKRIW